MPEPTFQNLGFEAQGATPGMALGWTYSQKASAEEFASFGEHAQETFESGWSSNEGYLFSLPLSSLVPAYFDEALHSDEDFEDGWSQNESYQFELTSASAAIFGLGPKLVEDFTGSWSNNEAYKFSFAPEDLITNAPEGFETDWRDNQGFLFKFSSSSIELLILETFETSWSSMTSL